MVAECNRIVNESSPIVDVRLKDGSRVNIVLPPVALNGPIVTIRRFPKEPMNMEKLIRTGSLPREAAQWLELLVKAGFELLGVASDCKGGALEEDSADIYVRARCIK